MSSTIIIAGRAVRRTTSWWILLGGAALLVAAIAFQIGRRADGKVVRSGKETRIIADRLKMPAGSWRERELEIGKTEVERRDVAKILQFDEVLFREYEFAAGDVALYVAYWHPGQVVTQIVSAHTPDRCWTSAGWQCESLVHRVELKGRETQLRAGERRVFSRASAPSLHVQFWHLIGDRLYDYAPELNRDPLAWRWLRDVTAQFFESPPEQLFVRISSARPFEQLAGDPGWEELMKAVARLGLQESPSRPDPSH